MVTSQESTPGSKPRFIPKGWVVLTLFIATQTVYLVMLLITLPHLMELSGDMKPFDLMPGGYDFDYAQQFLGSIGPQGRDFYLTRQIPLDLIYPGLYAITFALLWRWLAVKIPEKPGLLSFGTYLPILAGVFDYAENGLVITMLIQFAGLSQFLVMLASTATIIKSVTTSVYFITLLALIITIALYKLKPEKR